MGKKQSKLAKSTAKRTAEPSSQPIRSPQQYPCHRRCQKLFHRTQTHRTISSTNCTMIVFLHCLNRQTWICSTYYKLPAFVCVSTCSPNKYSKENIKTSEDHETTSPNQIGHLKKFSIHSALQSPALHGP